MILVSIVKLSAVLHLCYNVSIQLVQENTSSREEAQNSPSDGMELFMEFLIRQYRRRMQVPSVGD